MKVGISGLGYVGLVTAAVLAEHGNSVTGIDIDIKKIEKLQAGISPIFEPDLQETLSRFKERLSYSENYRSISECDIVYITVPTPNVDGKLNLKYVESAMSSIIDQTRNAVIAIKSTVLPGTAARLSEKYGIPIVSNPEFTREGNAMEDTRHPDRIVIGSSDMKSAQKIRELWDFTKSNFLITTNENAELIKYASNSFLATKISFINELADLCEKIPKCDITVVAKGMGYDKRIAPYFLNAGIGYGGSCFPKDTQALVTFADSMGVSLNIVKSAINHNSMRVNHVIDLIRKSVGKDLEGKHVAIMGISFKENTDDVRESPAVKLAEDLIRLGARITAYNPVPVKVGLPVPVNTDLNNLPKDLDLIVIASEWNEFKSLENMNIEVPVIDAKRILSPSSFTQYVGVGLFDN